jgi:hypothetical protein
LSKSSAARLIQGRANPAYLEKITPVLVAGLRSFLAAARFPDSFIESEIASLFTAASAPDDVQTIVVPEGRAARYIFKDQSGRILRVVEVKG